MEIVWLLLWFYLKADRNSNDRQDKKYGLQSIAVFCAKNGPAINAYNRREEWMYVRFMEN